MTKHSHVIPEELPKRLIPKRSAEMEINLKSDASPKTGPIYKLSRKELDEMKDQLEQALIHRFITPLISLWASSILFIPKTNGTLRICIGYTALKKKTIKNRVSLPQIDEI